MPFTLTSSAFSEGGAIPRENTCDGADVSPALAWTGTPDGASALALVVDDPDAGGFVHWIVVMDHTRTELPRAFPPDTPDAVQGTNGFGRVGYGGPCPPSGTHHYRFTLTAVAGPLDLGAHPRIAELRAALGKASVLGEAVLTGTYKRG